MGCKAIKTRYGRVALRLIWTYRHAKFRSQETLGLKWTKASEAAAQRDMGDPISREMRAGIFSPQRYLEL